MNPDLDRLLRQWRQLKQRLFSAPESSTMLELLRPNLGNTPLPLRRWLEPVVAVAAVTVLAALLGLGFMSLTVFIVAAALMYAILTQVFGIELGLHMPQNPL